MKRCYKSLSSRVPSIPSHVWAMTLFCHSTHVMLKLGNRCLECFHCITSSAIVPHSVDQSQSKLPNEPDIAYIVMEFT
jgi:hypothetical protein